MAKVEQTMRRYWWLSVVAGVLLILFGIAALFWPGLTLVLYILLFSILMIVWGILVIVDSFSLMKIDSTWWLELLFGVLALILGVFLAKNPDVSFGVIVILTAASFIARGLIDVLSSLFGEKRNDTTGLKIITIIAGVLGIIAGIAILNYPIASGVAFAWIAGLYAVLVGTLMVSASVIAREEVEKLRR